MSSSYQPTQTLFGGSIRSLDFAHRFYMRLSRFVSPERTCRTQFGALMHCRTRDFVQRRIRFFQIFEHNLTYYTLDKLREGDVYLDIGANVGYFSLLAASRVGKTGKVIAIEADPTTFQALERNIALNAPRTIEARTIEARNVAATRARCRVDIQRQDPANSGSNAIAVRQGTDGIEGLPFDEILGEDLTRVRFVKIDIEGSERPILESILEHLPRLAPDLIVASEVSSGSGDMVEYFAAAGFACYAMPNVYTIDYYLIRSYLRRYGETHAVPKVPVTVYDPRYTDYVFERRPLV